MSGKGSDPGGRERVERKDKEVEMDISLRQRETTDGRTDRQEGVFAQCVSR